MEVEQEQSREYVDLHIHTNFSDGISSIDEVLEIASIKKLKAVSITDHDCMDAYPSVIEKGEKLGLEVIPGVELSSEVDGNDIHILGYFVDPTNEKFAKKLKEMKDARYVRAEKIVKNLNKMGLDLRFDTVLAIAGNGSIGRPHIAAAMIKEELVYSYKEAFEKYLGYGSPAYVEKFKLEPEEVFKLIRGAGGIPILAHPGITKVDEKIPEFIKKGLVGIEVYHTEHTPPMERYYLKLAEKYNIAISGGSDYHNSLIHKSQIGFPSVPYKTVESLLKAAKR
ncbi:MAG: PHP domain-containing protein [Chitinispirillaceae bacterium]|nr:PHP domain-containing protein [Chitinispirillaceae bacterium]